MGDRVVWFGPVLAILTLAMFAWAWWSEREGTSCASNSRVAGPGNNKDAPSSTGPYLSEAS